VGRGLYALLTLLPMGVGAAYGAGSRRQSRSAWRFPGQFLAGVLALVVVAIAVVVALPGRVAPITGGVSELAYAGKLGLMIRGARPDLPVLLFVPDLPGGSELAATRDRLGALEQRFLVATMDRRGGGRSFGDLDPRTAQDRMEVERYADLLGKLKPAFIHHSESKRHLEQKILKFFSYEI